jgi:hypothetical protein
MMAANQYSPVTGVSCENTGIVGRLEDRDESAGKQLVSELPPDVR